MIAWNEINPYWGKDIGEFLLLFVQRMVAFCMGKLPLSELASDELQILVLTLIALSCSLVGTILYLRKMTMLANALSHTILLGIVFAYAFFHGLNGTILAKTPSLGVMLLASLFAAFFTVFLTHFFTKKLKLQEDASIGLVFSALFALGVLFVSLLTKNAHIGIEIIMGNVDLLHINDLFLSLKMFILNAFLILSLYRYWQSSSFDSSYAASLGIPTAFLQNLLMLLTAISCITAFRLVGVLLLLSFLVGPPMIARFYTVSLRSMLFVSSVLSVVFTILGVALSRHLLSIYQMPLSTGGLTATLIFVYALISGVLPRKRRKAALALHNTKAMN